MQAEHEMDAVNSQQNKLPECQPNIHGANCNCQGEHHEERYLGLAQQKQRKSPSTRVKSRPQSNIDDSDLIDDDLLHILITRPEIAAKPRDNIIFEGDMDLKTTFETSYEKLAKMRLDSWKKYQDMKSQIGHTGNGAHEDVQMEQVKKRNGTESSKVDATDWQRSEFRNDERRARSGRETDHSDRAGQATSNALDEEKDATRERHSSSKQLIRDTPVATELVFPRSVENPPSDQYIDPDLSPLIVYNANMNRLDTVGLRRRSKYRPSTTLKPGSRGLFGDGELILGESRQTKNRLDECKHPSMVPDQAAVERPEVKGQEEHHKEARQVNGAESRADHVLNVRNLRDSRQPNNLVYSDINLPVDSKRKAAGNINMVDHIKEQSIVSAKNNYSNDLSMIRQNVEDMKLAHEEEVAAMDELRRVTSKSPAFDNNIRDDNQAAIERQAETESRNKSSGSVSSGNRQSRLQRTCQNQNFDIFENQYPELSGQQAHEASFHKRKSPHLKQPQPYMNLFRESPDFTLTINTANQYYQPMEEADYARKSEDKLDGMKIEYTEMDEALAAISHEPVSTNDHCKVMDLDRDFRFLGSLSGHKYFVERTGE